MSNYNLQRKETAAHTYNYPFAAAPDIIHAHQKDGHFKDVLFNHLCSLLRSLCGARFIHNHLPQIKVLSEISYLGLTTFIGNRTLGEEYSDIVQVEDDTFKLPAIGKRAGYILTSILLPYALTKTLPKFRSRIRAKLESNLRRLTEKQQTTSRSYRVYSYLLKHLSAITSLSVTHAVTLATFYFSGAYYQLSKRIWGLRYIFTKRIAPSEARVGYEVLGALLLLQISVQAWLHLQEAVKLFTPATSVQGGMVEGCLDTNSTSLKSELLPEHSLPVQPQLHSEASVYQTTHTKLLISPRYNLRTSDLMPWIKDQNRKCTLCLECLKDPSAAECGHVFCWVCIGNWIREKPECPLCRREVSMQHILPLRI